MILGLPRPGRPLQSIHLHQPAKLTPCRLDEESASPSGAPNRVDGGDDVENRLWVSCNDPEEDASAPYGRATPPLPVSERRDAETHEGSEFWLRQTIALAQETHVRLAHRETA
jgi:hypothetical protein